MTELLELLILLLGVYWTGTTFGDAAGTLALWILIAVLIALFIRGWRDSSQAFGNFVRYWRDGGPDRK